MDNFKIGIALGGGGMCGIAHIGFLQVLEENNIKIDMISGISMGAIIGGLYASGVSCDELIKISSKLKKNDIIETNMFKILKESLPTSNKIEKFLKKYLKAEKIEDCKIKFYPQAADMIKGELHTFENGSMIEAMRASSAIPGIFPPIKKDKTYYVDGGVIENVPFKILKEKGADVIIAVNCLSNYTREELPKNTINMLINCFECAQWYEWKTNKEFYKSCYDLYCFDNNSSIKPFCTDIKVIPNLIESGRESAKKYIAIIKKLLKKKKKILKNT